jgi:cellulose synthase/poly-beta-1,6-N-acetylglucosamine synthase-like glycosyltransferase
MRLRDRLHGSATRFARRFASKGLQRGLRRTYHMARSLLVWPPVLWQRHVDPGFARRLAEWRSSSDRPEVSLVIVTYNRLGMLRECTASLLERSSGPEFEVVVWDNASTDGTREFLDELATKNPVMRVFHSPENIGLNAVSEGVKLARGFYIFEFDDDVIEFPDEWLQRMVAAFRRVPRAGYLATNVLRNEKTDGARAVSDDMPVHDYGDGIVIEEGNVGGWCAMTSLEALRRVGNFRSKRGRIFLLEDGDFAGRCVGAGLSIGVVRDVVVYHACGPVLNLEYGCIDTTIGKYSDSPEFAASLAYTKSVVASRKADD